MAKKEPASIEECARRIKELERQVEKEREERERVKCKSTSNQRRWPDYYYWTSG